MKKKIEFVFILISFVLVSKQVYPQLNITGKVVESISNVPIPFVNIAVHGSYMGTISNDEGNFAINIPEKYNGRHLVFSCIGYKPDTIVISPKSGEIIVQLEKKATELSEVIVMPKNTLYKLLKSAYDKIPENYPTNNTGYKGFFRETERGEKGNYLSYGEAYIETIRGSVNLKDDKGQIKILKSRGGNLSGRDSTTNILFYGGIFSATSDFVQSRAGFINPAHFNNYNYQIQKMDRFFKISFSSKKKNSGSSGYFLLDTLSLAYTEAAYSTEGNGLDVRYKRLGGESFYKFIELDGKQYLKYVSKAPIGYDRFKKKKIIHSIEYLSTDIIPDIDTKIPEKEQVGYFDIFIDAIPNYQDNYWEGFTILETDSLLKIDQQTLAKVAVVLTDKNKPAESMFVSIVKKLSLKYGLTYSTTSISDGNYYLSIPDIGQSFQNSLNDCANWSIYSSVGYFFSRQFAASFSQTSSLPGANRYNERLIGLKYKRKINRFGAPCFVSFSSHFGQATADTKIGSFVNSEKIHWGGKSLNSKNLDVFVGNRALVFKPEISFYRHLKGFSSFYIGFSYNIVLSDNRIVAMKEQNGLFRKKAIEDFSDINYNLSVDNNPIQEIEMSLPKFTISCGINLIN